MIFIDEFQWKCFKEIPTTRHLQDPQKYLTNKFKTVLFHLNTWKSNFIKM